MIRSCLISNSRLKGGKAELLPQHSSRNPDWSRVDHVQSLKKMNTVNSLMVARAAQPLLSRFTVSWRLVSPSIVSVKGRSRTQVL